MKHAILLGLIICLALGLRLFRLGHQELRGDEAFDALFASQPVSVILGQLQTAQPYPPLFHVGLHFWLDLIGQSEIMQRLPAVISSVLLVPLVYQLARLTLGEVTGMIAALLVAMNPFYIWHAQDGRMYSLLAMLSAGSIWLGLRLLRDRSTLRTGLAYLAVTTLALLTHYFAWLILVAENVAAALIIWRQDQRQGRLSRWLMWQGAIILLLLPWLVFASGLLTSHASDWIPPLTPLQMLQRSLVAFSLGLTLEPALALAFSLVMGALFVLGCFFPSQPAHPEFKGIGRGLLLLFVSIPLLATMLLSIQRPAFDEKYLIAIVTCYLILVAHGLHFLGTKGRPIGIAAGMFILLATGWSLGNYYFNPEYAKSPSWRSLVENIEVRAAERDLIIQNYPDPSLGYYYEGGLPIQLLPAAVPSPREKTERTLWKLAGSHDRIWLIPGPAEAWDAEGFVDGWLARYADLVDETEFDSLRLQLYHTHQTFLEEMQAVDAEFGAQVRLLGYRPEPEAVEPLSPGDRVSLTLYWQIPETVGTNYTVFVHLSDSSEQIWGQHDGQPVNGTYSTSEWEPGQTVVDHHTIEISPEAPSGLYRLMTGMYDGATGQRLAITVPSDLVDENRIVLTAVRVAVPDERAPGSENQGQ
jgi:4-amino-4-deoxy-L-arabinose transferase-like glycosyltransferase